MKKSKKKSFILSQKQIRTLALLVVALLTTSTILILGGFEIDWKELWNSILKR